MYHLFIFVLIVSSCFRRSAKKFRRKLRLHKCKGIVTNSRDNGKENPRRLLYHHEFESPMVECWREKRNWIENCTESDKKPVVEFPRVVWLVRSVTGMRPSRHYLNPSTHEMFIAVDYWECSLTFGHKWKRGCDFCDAYGWQLRLHRYAGMLCLRATSPAVPNLSSF